MRDFSSQHIAQLLLKIEAVKVRLDPPFQLVSGIKSPVYCDNRMIISFVEQRRVIVDAFKALINNESLAFDVIGGTATAAIPWASFVAYELDVPMVYIRPEAKQHGASKQVEGFLEKGKRVLIIEDLISTGGSSVKAALAVRNECLCLVSDVLAIVSWELPESKKAFEEGALKLHYLTGFESIISEAAGSGYLDTSDVELVRRFKEDPWNWGQ